MVAIAAEYGTGNCYDSRMGENQTIYLDANATSPPRPEAFEAMRPWLTEQVGNPASAHAAGRQARRALEDAREQIAALLGAFPDEVVFTSGATEANNLAIFGLCGDPPSHLLASTVEHPCVVEPLNHLAKRGFELDWLPVTGEGIVEPQTFAAKVRPETRLIAIMLANHETGAVQPVRQLSTRYSVFFHCDAAQAVGKMPVNFHDLGVTALSASGHKFGVSAGIGVLLVNRCTRLNPMLFGGHQQRGRRPGTEPVAWAVGFAAALAASLSDLNAMNSRMSRIPPAISRSPSTRRRTGRAQRAGRGRVAPCSEPVISRLPRRRLAHGARSGGRDVLNRLGLFERLTAPVAGAFGNENRR